jgi:hypothetical protein
MAPQDSLRAGDLPTVDQTTRDDRIATASNAGEGTTTASGSMRQACNEPEQKLTGWCCSPSPRTRQGEGEDRTGPAWLLVLLLPLACCGGPLLIGALAAAGAAAWGVLGVVIAVVLGVTLVGIRRRTAGRRSLAGGGQRTISRPAAGPTSGAPR